MADLARDLPCRHADLRYRPASSAALTPSGACATLIHFHVVARPQFRSSPRHRSTRGAAALSALGALVCALAWAAPAQATTQTFTYTGAEQTFTVPVGVYSLHVLAIGGSGGASELAGGAAARVGGQLEVSPGKTLYVEVGGDGHNGGLSGGAGGFNGGGAAGNTGAGGGGGGSDVRTSPRSVGLSPDDRLIVAGGGGGTGGAGIESTDPPPSIAISYPANGATYTQGQAISAVYFCNAGEGTGLKACTGTAANGAPFETATLGQHTFTVEAEDTDGGKATQTVTYTVATIVACPVDIQQQAAQADEACPELPHKQLPRPNTILDSHPKKTTKTTTKKVKVRFSFSSDPTGATFKCKLDKGAFAPCASPKTFKVKPGKHTFSVEAVNSAGTDPTPATFAFKVKEKHKHH